MKALVLGGAGFIGLHLTRRLLSDGHEVTVVDDFSRGRNDPDVAELKEHPGAEVISADLTTPQSWARLPRDVDQVYLLAAVVGVRNVERDPSRVIRINTLTVLHLLDWVPDTCRVFFASTSEVYAGGVDAGLVPVPTAEDVPVMVADPASPRFAYAISKLLGEAAFLHAARAARVEAVVGRFHNVYGPRMGTDHVIPEMSLRAIHGQDPFKVPGADQFRSFCYVDDAVEAVVRLMACDEAVGEIVHIGDDTEQTNIGDLAKLVCRVAGVSPAIAPQPAPVGSVGRRCPDLTLLRRLTAFQPGVGLEEGVERTLRWYRRTEPGMDQNPIAFYYGQGHVEELAGYRRVVLQPDAYDLATLLALAKRHTQALAYLSLSEDAGPPAPWHRGEVNADWGSRPVYVSHPGWVEHVTAQATAALRSGFTGLFLDNLNVEWTHPEDLPHLLALIGSLREIAGPAYLLANRGFGLLPELAEHVDGVLFESFTTRWVEDGYASWPTDVLEGHAEVAERLLGLDLDLFALDYADDPTLAAFAARRAQQFGMSSFIADRLLSRPPVGS